VSAGALAVAQIVAFAATVVATAVVPARGNAAASAAFRLVELSGLFAPFDVYFSTAHVARLKVLLSLLGVFLVIVFGESVRAFVVNAAGPVLPEKLFQLR
jgi:hypothetical protein